MNNLKPYKTISEALSIVQGKVIYQECWENMTPKIIITIDNNIQKVYNFNNQGIIMSISFDQGEKNEL